MNEEEYELKKAEWFRCCDFIRGTYNNAIQDSLHKYGRFPHDLLRAETQSINELAVAMWGQTRK